jgi:hypothetical protein
MRSVKLLLAGLTASALVVIAGTALASTPDTADLTATPGPADLTATSEATDLTATPDAADLTATRDTTDLASVPEGTDRVPASEGAEPYEGPGTTDEPVYACLPIDGRTICDTFGEAEEGPGTH